MVCRTAGGPSCARGAARGLETVPPPVQARGRNASAAERGGCPQWNTRRSPSRFRAGGRPRPKPRSRARGPSGARDAAWTRQRTSRTTPAHQPRYRHGEQLGLGKALCKKIEHGGDPGERPAVNHKRRNLALRVEREIFGRAQVVVPKRHRLAFKGHAELAERDLNGHRTRSRREIERQHVYLTKACAIPPIAIPRAMPL